jgi:protein O-mannosyl-transferase
MPREAIVEAPVTSSNLHSESDHPTGWARRLIFAPILLLAAAFLTYAPALKNGFVWDDQALILRDPLIRSWRLIGVGFQHFLFTDAAACDFYRPLQRLSYTLDYAAFFIAPAGYHFVSVLWHAGAAIALFYFAEEFLARCEISRMRRLAAAFFASLVWLVHPVQSAAVVYISGRADPLAAGFGFLGLFLGLRMLRANRTHKWLFGFGAAFCFLASALSKEIGLIFLLLWLILSLTQRARTASLGTAAILSAVLCAYLGLRLPAEQFAPPPPPPIPLLVRPIITARAVAEYSGLLLWPLHLHMEREVETQPFGFTPASLNAAAWRELQTLLGLVLIAAGVAALCWSRRQPGVFLPLLLAAVSYLPVSGLIRLNATVAEHWLYLPSAFLFLGAAVAFESLGRSVRTSYWSKAAWVALTIWVFVLPLRTFARTFDWKDQRTFLTRTITGGGDSARMLINLGALKLSEGHLDAARHALARALVKEPDNPLARLNLAAVEIKQHNFRSARIRLEKIAEPPELRARAQESLAVLENRETGKINLIRLQLAARLGAPNWEIEQRYIKTCADLGFAEQALSELHTCLTIAPYRAESWLLLSDLLRQIGRPNESAVALAQAEAADVHLHQRVAGPLVSSFPRGGRR